ncbi:MAG TPA: c-type cytochrome domain-containing protein [Saprospiraceae bacterium]|nr:c-type cytochrome domain-containing protein [Saprospiraceae bacterium]
MKKMLLLGIGLTGLVLLNSCTSEYISDGHEVCFEQEVKPLIISSCTQSECHNPDDLKSDLDLTTYEGILSIVQPGSFRKSELYKVITDPFNPMPTDPYERLNKEQITTLSLWIEQGAKNEICTEPACDTLSVGFSSTIKPIMDIYCNGCHTGPRPQGGIDFNKFTGIKEAVDNGSFLGTIRRDVGFIAMPKNGSRLPSCKISQIEKWIREGAANN